MLANNPLFQQQQILVYYKSQALAFCKNPEDTFKFLNRHQIIGHLIIFFFLILITYPWICGEGMKDKSSYLFAVVIYFIHSFFLFLTYPFRQRTQISDNVKQLQDNDEKWICHTSIQIDFLITFWSSGKVIYDKSLSIKFSM